MADELNSLSQDAHPMRIPHAIFTSLKGERLEGYQLAARSEEITEAMAHELNTWGPAHDSLFSESSTEPSINFHPLSGDWHCLSLTRNSGAEYSARAGARVYTQMFLLSREALARFDNNPFLIRRAIQAAGREMVLSDVPARMRSFPLVGRAETPELESDNPSALVSSAELRELAAAINGNESVALVTSLQAEVLVASLFQVLRPNQRLDVSFTTGLRHSPRRPFRLFFLPPDPALRRQFQRQPGIKLVDIGPPQGAPRPERQAGTLQPA